MRRRGFTLLEILMVVALLAILAALALPSLKTYKEREEVRAGAQRLVADLAMARQLARARGVPVGLVLTSPQSYEIREGFGDDQHLLAHVDWTQELAGAHLFVGDWKLESGHATTLDHENTGTVPSFNDIALSGWTTTSLDARHYATGDTTPLAWFTVASWGRGVREPVFLFWPNGMVKSNRLPMYDDAWHVVVASAFVSRAVADTRRLERVYEPAYSVVLGAGGQARVVSGVPAAAIETVSQGSKESDQLPRARPPTPAAAELPAFVGTPILAPDNVAGTPAHNVAECGQPVALFANLEPSATQQPVACFWRAAAGRFSAQGSIGTTWLAPSTPGWYQIGVSVASVRSPSRAISGSVDVEVVAPEEIVFDSGGTHLMVVGAEGNGLRDITPPNFAVAASPCWAPDGVRLVFVGKPEKSADAADAHNQLWLMNGDGGALQRLTSDSGMDSVSTAADKAAPAWSPDGTRLAFEWTKIEGNGAANSPQVPQTDIWMCYADGSGAINLTQFDSMQGAAMGRTPTWSNDGKWVYFRRQKVSSFQQSGVQNAVDVMRDDICRLRTDTPSGGQQNALEVVASDTGVNLGLPAYAPGPGLVWSEMIEAPLLQAMEPGPGDSLPFPTAFDVGAGAAAAWAPSSSHYGKGLVMLGRDGRLWRGAYQSSSRVPLTPDGLSGLHITPGAWAVRPAVNAENAP